MAIDTERKRKSAAHVGEYANPVTVVPDGTIAVADRYAIGWSYAGIVAQEGVKNLLLLGVG